MEYPEDITIDIGVMRFVKQYRDRAVLSAIADRFAKEPDDVRKRLLDVLKDIPSIAEEVAKIEPRLTQTQNEKVSEEPIRNGLLKFRCAPAISESTSPEGTVKRKRKPQEKIAIYKPFRPFSVFWQLAADLGRQLRVAWTGVKI